MALPAAVRRALANLALAGLSCLLVLALSEAAFTVCLWNPRLVRALPGRAAGFVRRDYLARDRSVLQAMPCCARYDRELYYTLAPGTFRFRNREFDDEFRVNHLGLRDTEDALSGPELIVLGDSYAMGWGVPQDATVAALLGRELGLRTLNAGIASYGTVRELRLLDRLDRSRLADLVIQYCSGDDFLETHAFLTQGNSFTVGDERRYLEDQRRAERRRRYWFPRRTFELVRAAIGPRQAPALGPFTPEQQARDFVNALLHAGRARLEGVRLYVFSIAPDREVDDAFVLALQKEVSDPRYPRHVRGLRVVALRGRLGPDDYYDLDDHLRPAGQAKVAQALVELLRAERGAAGQP